jgi:hypothetical protein
LPVLCRPWRDRIRGHGCGDPDTQPGLKEP